MEVKKYSEATKDLNVSAGTVPFINEPFDINKRQLELLMGSPAFEISVRSYIGASMHRRALPKAYRALARPTLADCITAPLAGQGRSEMR